MKAPAFGYVRPSTLDECLDLLAEHGNGAAVLAGGQSLMPLLNLRLAAPKVLVDINTITALDGVREEGDDIVIGALTRHAAIAVSPLIARALPLLTMAAPHIAHAAIRNRGTFGGSLALADPAAEWPLCSLALDAVVELASVRGRRRVPASSFFEGVYSTARAPDELIVAVRFRRAVAGTVHRFEEIARRRGDFAIVALALTAVRNGPRLRSVRIAFAGVGDRPVLLHGAMQIMEGQVPTVSIARDMADQVAAELQPPDDPTYPADYRRRVAAVLMKRVAADLGHEASDAS